MIYFTKNVECLMDSHLSILSLVLESINQESENRIPFEPRELSYLLSGQGFACHVVQ